MSTYGLAAALTGIDVAIDATQAPIPDDSAADFFRATVGNLHAAAHRAGVGHVVLLSIVGIDAAGDHRMTSTGPTAGQFALPPRDALTAGVGARLATTRYRDWLATRTTTAHS
ncbi:hypothetical protein [Nocardia africana]|uniref:NAD(P)-binding domain-containing protein n=1 Tax=Nocardia africana TaxID=134964 RepID=A0A378WUN3_9NOCA|nr:hypothetical protein [Nocardia africana]MCC3313758.1 hypothetical protein [Nocardia africana]SUA44859.1 Uncharacterised protein [Nocardia africana]